MQNQLININQNMTMSSREIAELTGKEHSNIMRDIRSMLESLQNSDLNPVCNSTTYVGENGQKYPMYELDKDTTLTLLLGYDAVARMRVVKRWQELENQQTPKVPTTFIEAMTLALEQAKQLEAQKPLVDFANTVQTSSALIDMKDLAKVISDTTIKIGRNTLMKLLRDRGFLNMDNTPSQKSVNADLMKAVEKTWINPKTDNAEITVVAHITGKGQIYLCNNIRKFMENK